MDKLEKQQLSIGEAARYLGVSQMTLRRWDEDGSFKATFVSPGGHRYYSLSDLEKKTKGIFKVAEDWAASSEPYDPAKDFYCQTSDIFKARHERMTYDASEKPALQPLFSLISSAAGEIGNNSFDHNIGNWPDIMGMFFANDLNKRLIVLADRGMGVLATLHRVRPAR